MDIVQKRKLMVAVETLAVRPGNATEHTLADAMVGFQELIKHVNNGELGVVYVAHNPQAQEDQS